MPDCYREGRIFYLPLTPKIESFSCTPFISEDVSDIAVDSIADVRDIVMTLLWRLMTSLRSVM